MKKLSEESIEEMVTQVVANHALDGMICDKEDIEAMRRLGRGETTLKEENARIDKKWTEMGYVRSNRA